MVFRHRHVEVCPVGAIATLYFVWFHVLNCLVPDFKPDFTDPRTLGLHPKRPMTYDNHCDRINAIYAKNNISFSKVTHAGRGYVVKFSRENEPSVEGVKALGGWSESGSFRPCYDRALAVDACSAQLYLMRNGRRRIFCPGNLFFSGIHSVCKIYRYLRAELMSAFFPWVEREQLAREAREADNRMTADIAHMISPFSSPNIPRVPSSDSLLLIPLAFGTSQHDAQIQVKLALANLPRNVADTFLGAVSNFLLEQKREQDASRQTMAGKKSRKRGELANAHSPTIWFNCLVLRFNLFESKPGTMEGVSTSDGSGFDRPGQKTELRGSLEHIVAG
ncbi:hypothetical protein B0H19DRAFT_1083062 [Mycena capillaripes]|nr:hypothetical protein B0H19DRAFT_1083062 [Mycena capillaripes]